MDLEIRLATTSDLKYIDHTRESSNYSDFPFISEIEYLFPLFSLAT